jgi:superfamily I DNA/RNA helicase
MTERNRIFPPWSEINNLKVKLTRGEEFLAKYLDNNLPTDWNIYLKTEFEWGGGKTPDIVIAHKSKGIMIFEVKDINIKNYCRKKISYKKNQIAKFHFCKIKKDKKTSKKIIFPIKDPVEQLQDYRDKLFENLPEIAWDIIADQNKLKLIRGGIYFHHHHFDKEFTLDKIKKMIRLFNPGEIHLFSRRQLEEGKNNIEYIVPFLNENYAVKMGEKWFDRFYNWIYPPLHKFEHGIKLTFNKRQKYYINPKPRIYQKLFGVAGSGKTLVLAHRAAKLLSENKTVLIVCFNITLKHYIREQIEKPYLEFSKKKLTIEHFHGFTKMYAGDKNIPYPFVGDVSENLIEHVNQVIDNRKKDKNYKRYDAILIDEGQDFEEHWYKFLCDFLTENEEVLFAIDKKQNIYKRDLEWAKGRAGELLDQGYRLPKNQIKIINQFSKEFLTTSDDAAENSVIIPPDEGQLSLLPAKYESIWKTVKSFDDVKKELHTYLLYLIKDLSMKLSDIVILVDNRKEGNNLKEYIQDKLKIKNIMDVFSIGPIGRLKKITFKVDSPYLKMSTIHSFKGWEARNVIIVTPEKKLIDSNLYAALTRVRENLIVINQNKRYQKFGDENFEIL